ncbi:ovomucoid-like [Ornithorhynchus anatinus]|uniref:ovomucoid-like n=1 Tax=Ornithorhynchus anatinus TaxID=9258 RepID=UPI0019D444A8|nr:ovomucoid-like [Ornithorhynchus anatinus]
MMAGVELRLTAVGTPGLEMAKLQHVQQINSGLDVKKLHNGSCIDCNRPVEICTMERRPHCGSDGRTYGNQCDFCDAIQKSHGALYLVKYGVC